MNKQVGFIGCGKMAQAIIEGMLKAQVVNPEQIIASAFSTETLRKVKDAFDIHTTRDNQEVAQKADLLFLAVKPDIYTDVIEEIRGQVREETIVITIAGGTSLEFVQNAFNKSVKVVRTMPNTPSLVGEGMTAVCPNHVVNEAELEDVLTILNSFGKTEIMEEKLMDSVPAISGSSPAYVYMFIEALADGGVMQGIPREKAYKLASQAVLGAAKMVLETGEHPGSLKDNVCTPGGSTIEAVATLEKQNFRAAVIKAMEACTVKSKELANKLD